MDKKLFRNIVIGVILVVFSIFSLRHLIFGGRVAPSIDAICPFGGFETLYTAITTGNFVPGILISGVIVAVSIILSLIFFRRGFCGWLCPFGIVQEFFGKITKKKITVPANIDKKLRYLKYFVLLMILILTAITGTLIFKTYDPFLNFFHFGKGVLWSVGEESALVGFVIAIIVVLLSVFIERAWCKYFCPLGAVMGLFSIFSFSKIKRDNTSCTNCKICDTKCPMGLKTSNIDSMKNVDCIDCMNCVNSCPSSSLSNQIFGKKIDPRIFVIGLILFITFALGLSMFFGIWNSSQTSTIVAANGDFNPENVKGWMTLKDLSDATKIPVSCFSDNLGLPENIDPTTALRDIPLKYNPDVDTNSFRTFLGYYSNGQIVC
jgi:polyferredoxin